MSLYIIFPGAAVSGAGLCEPRPGGLPRTRTENDLTCDICVDVMTDIDDFITSDTTEQQLVDFIKQVVFSI